MRLNLTRPLVVFDLETTGLDIAKDRIIQLSYIKVWPDGHEERYNSYINPGRLIPPEVTRLTGITDAMVQHEPTFKDVAQQLADTFAGCDFAGFNSNHFDVPLLAEEFLRARINFDFDAARLIDVQTIFHKMERRNLAAAYKFYCGRKMEDDFQAHLANEDTEATYRVLQAQLDMYAPGRQEEPERQLHNDVDELAAFSKTDNNVDFAGRIVWKYRTDAQGNVIKDADGKPQRYEVFNFGKHKGKAVTEVLHDDQGYYNWVLGGDFPCNTKLVLERIKLREYNKR